MGRPKNTDMRRMEIVSALGRVMAERGYEGASVQRIAKAAELTPSLVHYHFDSKREILLALVSALVALAEARVEARVDAATSPRGRVFAFLDGLLATGDSASTNAVALWALVGAEAIRHQDVRDGYQAWIARAKNELERLLRAVCHDEGRSARGIGAIAAGLVASVEGFYAVAAAAPDIIPSGSAAGIARRMATGLIESQKEVAQ